MKNQFIARCTFLALLYGTSTSAQPIDFEGAAWVAGPAVLGALCAHEIHQQSVDKIEERLDVVLLFKQVVEKNLIRSQETKVFLD